MAHLVHIVPSVIHTLHFVSCVQLLCNMHTPEWAHRATCNIFLQQSLCGAQHASKIIPSLSSFAQICKTQKALHFPMDLRITNTDLPSRTPASS